MQRSFLIGSGFCLRLFMLNFCDNLELSAMLFKKRFTDIQVTGHIAWTPGALIPFLLLFRQLLLYVRLERQKSVMVIVFRKKGLLSKLKFRE